MSVSGNALINIIPSFADAGGINTTGRRTARERPPAAGQGQGPGTGHRAPGTGIAAAPSGQRSAGRGRAPPGGSRARRCAGLRGVSALRQPREMRQRLPGPAPDPPCRGLAPSSARCRRARRGPLNAAAPRRGAGASVRPFFPFRFKRAKVWVASACPRPVPRAVLASAAPSKAAVLTDPDCT